MDVNMLVKKLTIRFSVFPFNLKRLLKGVFVKHYKKTKTVASYFPAIHKTVVKVR